MKLRGLAIAVSVSLSLLGAVQLADLMTFGISPMVVRWIGIVATGLGVLATFLPRVQGATPDLATLADLLWNLSPSDRQAVAAELEERAEREAGDASTTEQPPFSGDS